MRIYKEFYIEAAHKLPSAPEGHPNSRVHGHSFRVRISVDGVPDPTTGLVLHFNDMTTALSALRDELDHRYLNEIEGLDIPTLENIATWIWQRLSPDLPNLAEIAISRDTCQEGCVYSGPESPIK
ncbi:MAG: 6-carboxytetrahydropterin synthase [Pseudomonadota bacterium]